jgi:hypothetical protein
MGWLGSKPKDEGPSAQERQLSKQAVTDFNYHQANYVPSENQFISNLTPSQGETDALRGQQVADVALATKGQDQNVVANSGRVGLASGKSVLARHDLSTAEGTAKATGTTGADLALRDRRLTGLTKMVAFGRGLGDMNRLQSTGLARTQTAAGIAKMNQEVTDRGSKLNMIGTALGTGMSFYSARKKKPAAGGSK